MYSETNSKNETNTSSSVDWLTRPALNAFLLYLIICFSVRLKCTNTSLKCSFLYCTWAVHNSQLVCVPTFSALNILILWFYIWWHWECIELAIWFLFSSLYSPCWTPNTSHTCSTSTVYKAVENITLLRTSYSCSRHETCIITDSVCFVFVDFLNWVWSLHSHNRFHSFIILCHSFLFFLLLTRLNNRSVVHSFGRSICVLFWFHSMYLWAMDEYLSISAVSLHRTAYISITVCEQIHTKYYFSFYFSVFF